MEDISDHMYEVNQTWIKSVRRHLRKSLLDGLTEESKVSKSLSFLSFPVPECSCLRSESNGASSRASTSQLPAALKVARSCPAWMGKDVNSRPGDKENEDDLDDDDSGPFSLFFRPSGGGSNNRNTVSSGSRGGGEMMSSKEETQMEDQEEMEGGDR